MESDKVIKTVINGVEYIGEWGSLPNVQFTSPKVIICNEKIVNILCKNRNHKDD